MSRPNSGFGQKNLSKNKVRQFLIDYDYVKYFKFNVTQQWIAAISPNLISSSISQLIVLNNTSKESIYFALRSADFKKIYFLTLTDTSLYIIIEVG